MMERSFRTELSGPSIKRGLTTGQGYKPMAQMKEKVIPIVDLFAGPGGLGEGFASFQEAGW